MKAAEQLLTLLDSRSGQYWLALGIALCMTPLRGALNKLVFGPAGRATFEGDLKKALTRKEFQIRLRKWNEACWKAMFRIIIVGVGLAVSIREHYFTDPNQFWAGCTYFPPCNFPSIPRGLRLVFALELGFYLDAVPFLVFFEVRRNDFLENLAHHLVTLGLIFYSSQLNVVKVGVMIILCHEVNDIFMEAAKMGRYSGHELLPTAFFVAFAISWVLTRLVYFPYGVIWNIWTETPKLAKIHGANLSPHREVLLTMLCFLLTLHIYWSVLIFRIVYRKLAGKADLDDIREEPVGSVSDMSAPMKSPASEAAKEE